MIYLEGFRTCSRAIIDKYSVLLRDQQLTELRSFIKVQDLVERIRVHTDYDTKHDEDEDSSR